MRSGHLCHVEKTRLKLTIAATNNVNTRATSDEFREAVGSAFVRAAAAATAAADGAHVDCVFAAAEGSSQQQTAAVRLGAGVRKQLHAAVSAAASVVIVFVVVRGARVVAAVRACS